MKNIKNKKLVFSIVGLFIIVLLVLIITLHSPKDVTKIVGETITLEKTMQYCDKINKSEFEDDFSKVYGEKVEIKVSSINIETNEAILVVKAPPIKNMLLYCAENYESDNIDNFMEFFNQEISEFPEDEMIEKNIECSVKNIDGVNKIELTEEFYEAVFPELDELYKELLLEMIEVKSE